MALSTRTNLRVNCFFVSQRLTRLFCVDRDPASLTPPKLVALSSSV